jgi:hypothetical protein
LIAVGVEVVVDEGVEAIATTVPIWLISELEVVEVTLGLLTLIQETTSPLIVAVTQSFDAVMTAVGRDPPGV